MIIAITSTNNIPFPYKGGLDKIVDPMGEPEKPYGGIMQPIKNSTSCQPLKPATSIILVKEQGKINYLA